MERNPKKNHLIFLSGLLLWIGSAVCAQAPDPLDKVLGSHELESVTATTQKLRTNRESPEWFPPSSHFAQLFSGDLDPRVLAEWVSPPESGPLRLIREIGRRREEFLLGRREYAYGKGPVVSLDVASVHPRSARLVEAGLLKSFNEVMVIPPAEITAHFPITSTPWGKSEYFAAKDGSCSILSQVAERTSARLSAKPCIGRELLESLGAALNVTRLKAKLAT